MFRFCTMAVIVLALAARAAAVIVATGDGTQNTSAPANDFGFANVGRVFDTRDGFFTSGVYLGNGWMICAFHEVSTLGGAFVFGDVILSSSTYSVNSSSAVRLTTSGTGADLAVFRLNEMPGLPALTISSTTPPNNSAVVMMGNGVNRDTTVTNWTVSSGTNPTWTETTGTGNRSGYKTAGGQSLRWGTNNLSNSLISLNDGFGITTTVTTDFDNNTSEAQAATGDSGGGLFYQRSGNWELAGIMLTTDAFTNQPGGTAVFGNSTYAANLPSYRSQIVAIIPEPRTSFFAVIGTVVFICGFLRRKTSPPP